MGDFAFTATCSKKWLLHSPTLSQTNRTGKDA